MDMGCTALLSAFVSFFSCIQCIVFQDLTFKELGVKVWTHENNDGHTDGLHVLPSKLANTGKLELNLNENTN